MDRSVNVDYIGRDDNGGFLTSGSVAAKLLRSNFNVNSLRTNDVLYFRDWIELDRTIIQYARMRLVGVKDLFDMGLTYPVENALGVTRVEWERISDFGSAEISMSGVAEGQNERVKFDQAFVPLPIVHKDFNINIRALQASRRGGHPLDTSQAALAARIVAEKVENMLFQGGPNLGTLAGQVYGYTNAPNAQTGTLGFDWGQTATTGENMLTDLQTIIQDLNDQHHYGPYGIYVPNHWYIRMSDDFKTYGTDTILERLSAIPGVSFIRPSENLTLTSPNKGVVVVQLTPDVVDMIDGMQPTVVQWESHGGMVLNFKVMCILVPRMKSTQAAQSGIAYFQSP